MATAIKKISRLAVTGRASAAAFSTSATTATSRRRLILQTALYSGRGGTYSCSPQSHWFSSIGRVTGGQNGAGLNVCYSSAASAVPELHEKDIAESNKSYVPKDVVLYQYQACPFCNKVKANWFKSTLLPSS